MVLIPEVYGLPLAGYGTPAACEPMKKTTIDQTAVQKGNTSVKHAGFPPLFGFNDALLYYKLPSRPQHNMQEISNH